MAYFAEIDGDGLVMRLISVSNMDAPDPAPSNSEPLGQAFISDVLGLSGTFIQCSLHGNFRKQYCGPGYRYDADADVFVAPQPYPSWTLDSNHDWQAPIPRPSEGAWDWDEDTLSWIEVLS